MKNLLIFLSVLLPLSLFAQDKPNIVLVLLDDSGWTDFSCYGSEIETPNINKFTKEGIRFVLVLRET